MSITLDKIQGLIAGDGDLPVIMAENALKNGFEVVAISLSSDNRNRLKKYCKVVHNYGPGEVKKIKETLKAESIKQLTLIGKVHKGMLLRRPKLDSEAIALLKATTRLNDDAIMLTIVDELESVGVTVLDQTIFIKHLMATPGILGQYQPTEDEALDVNYGYWLAKEMGKLDVGQSVVIKNKMIMAVEAIEGTDKCIERGCRYGKGGVVVKVSKPTQDRRFDIPAVGVNTLKMMKKHGAHLLAVEANETIMVDQKSVIDYANKHKIIVMAV